MPYVPDLLEPDVENAAPVYVTTPVSPKENIEKEATTSRRKSSWRRGCQSAVLDSSTIKNHKTLECDQTQTSLRVVKAHGGTRQLTVPITIIDIHTQKAHSLDALLDTGCTGTCISRDTVARLGLSTTRLPSPIIVKNADDSHNAGGMITHSCTVRMQIDDHLEIITCMVTDLGGTAVFLGHEWISKHNPSVDWVRKEIEFDRCPDSCDRVLGPTDRLFAININRVSVAMDIAIEQSRTKAQKTFEQTVPAEYHQYRDVFSEETFDTLPQSRPYDHAIELDTDAKPYCGKLYPMTNTEQTALDEFLTENLATGRIRPSKSAWGAPFFFVKKKDGKLRPVQDYRRLNSVTKKNKYPLPLISELLDKLKSARFFTKLDIRWGYNNVRIRTGDEEKAAFLTNRGLYEPLVMFFGLCNAPSTFQMMMNDTFRDLILRGKVIVYLDDILIFTNDLDEHKRIVKEVLRLLRESRLTCKFEKCEFHVQETEYLGHIITPGEVRMDPAKVDGVTTWPTPTCKKDVQSFLGFANFYRCFIKDFAKLATPLNRLTGLNAWTWSAEEQLSFENLKTAITRAPVLGTPRDHGRFLVRCDASQFAVGAELSQWQDDHWKPIAFLSRALTPPQRNYEVYDRELLAIMTALEEWRHFLMGTEEQVEVHTDHQNLTYFRKPQHLNPRQVRWQMELQNYDLRFVHQPGTSMRVPDALSRRSDHFPTTGTPESVLLPDHMFANHTIAATYLSDTDIKQFARTHPPPETPLTQTEDGLVWKKGGTDGQQIVLSEHDQTFLGKVIAAHHDSVVAGHPGRDKTQELIQRSYWWPHIRRDIQDYVAACTTCRRTKADKQKKAAPLNPNPIPDRNWQHVSMDRITHLPASNGFDAILVFVDMKSKDYIPIPCTDTIDAEGVARLFINHVYSHHGLPDRIFSDRDTTFLSNFSRALFQRLGIKQNASTAFHPQTDGQTERVNQELEGYLRIFINHRQSDWSEWLPLAAFAHRNREHSSTGFSPFYMTHGYHAKTGSNTVETKSQTAEEFVSHMDEIQRQASEAIGLAQQAAKRKYDSHRTEPRQYKPGDQVWLSSVHISSDRPTKKLDDKYYGPFEIIEKIGLAAYRLKLPRTWKNIHPVFNEILLLPVIPSRFPGQPALTNNPPHIAGSSLTPEEILDSRFHRGGYQYLIKWKDRPRSENTWEKRRDLQTICPELLVEYRKKHPEAPQPLGIILAPRAREARMYTPYEHDHYRWDRTMDRWNQRRLRQGLPPYHVAYDDPDFTYAVS